MFQINLNGASPQWYCFPEGTNEKTCDCRLKIRRYPTSKSKTVVRRADKDTFEILYSGEDRKEAFLFALIDAEDLQDADGKSIKLNWKIKEYLYDYEFDSGIPTFVLKKAGIMIEEVQNEEKNSETGDVGIGENPN